MFAFFRRLVRRLRGRFDQNAYYDEHDELEHEMKVNAEMYVQRMPPVGYDEGRPPH